MSECIRPNCHRITHGASDGLCRAHRTQAGHVRYPASLVRKRILRLTEDGHTAADIARASGVEWDTINLIVSGQETVTMRVFRSVMSAQPGTPSYVPALPYLRMLRALAAAGVPNTSTAEMVGISTTYLSTLRSGTRGLLMRGQTADRVQHAFDTLGQHPVRTPDLRIARHRWPTPAAWDDEKLFSLPPYWQRCIDQGRGSLEWKVCLRIQSGERFKDIAADLGTARGDLVKVLHGYAPGRPLRKRVAA